MVQLPDIGEITRQPFTDGAGRAMAGPRPSDLRAVVRGERGTAQGARQARRRPAHDGTTTACLPDCKMTPRLALPRLHCGGVRRAQRFACLWALGLSLGKHAIAVPSPRL